MIGHQIRFFVAAFDKPRASVILGGRVVRSDRALVVMQCIVSMIVLAGAFTLLFMTDNEKLIAAAGGMIGTVLGYWLR